MFTHGQIANSLRSARLIDQLPDLINPIILVLYVGKSVDQTVKKMTSNHHKSTLKGWHTDRGGMEMDELIHEIQHLTSSLK